MRTLIQLSFFVATMLVALFPSATQAQENGALRVFLDCQRMRCDFNHLRREISFVNWVRDRQVAEIHVLGTSQGTGSGGREYTLAFIGRGRLAGRIDTLRFVTNTTDTDAEERDALARSLALGLVQYVVGTSIANRITIGYQAADVAEPTEPVDDPWNYWVFNTNVGGSLRGESQERHYSANGRFSASRVTEAWKLNANVRANYNRDEYDLDTTEVYSRRSYGFGASSVWSLGPRLSTGFFFSGGASTFSNQKLSLGAGPAVEFNVFPYSESTRRSITFRYSIGLRYYEYDEITIFEKLSETVPSHSFAVDVELQQPWGNVFTGFDARQMLNDLSKHSIELGGGFSFRLFRGLSLRMDGSVERVKDQINLPAGDLTPEEILVQRRERGTDFRYRTNVSFNYTFGSIFNNIVNPRF